MRICLPGEPSSSAGFPFEHVRAKPCCPLPRSGVCCKACCRAWMRVSPGPAAAAAFDPMSLSGRPACCQHSHSRCSAAHRIAESCGNQGSTPGSHQIPSLEVLVLCGGSTVHSIHLDSCVPRPTRLFSSCGCTIIQFP